MDVMGKLVELIEKASYECDEGTRDLWDMREVADSIADFFIDHGVTVQECKGVEIDPFNKWISVKDRLPETEDVFLCWSKDLADMVFCYTSDFKQLEVTHWMPLPQPPKGE